MVLGAEMVTNKHHSICMLGTRGRLQRSSITICPNSANQEHNIKGQNFSWQTDGRALYCGDVLVWLELELLLYILCALTLDRSRCSQVVWQAFWMGVSLGGVGTPL